MSKLLICVILLRNTKERRNDFVDLVLDALNAGGLKGIDGSTEEEIEMLMTSNALLLFFAGFDTTSTAMAAVTYFLCK